MNSGHQGLAAFLAASRTFRSWPGSTKLGGVRLFVGLDLPPEVIQALETFQNRLRPLAKLSWSPTANLHVTTKFIGEWPQDRVDELNQSLRGLGPREPVTLRVGGLGFYPNARGPRVFWAGIDAPPGLHELARQTDQALAALGVEPESRPFSPHLTLARIRTQVPLNRLAAEIERHGEIDFGQFTADRFFLYLSQRGSGGSVYTKLSEFPFSTP